LRGDTGLDAVLGLDPDVNGAIEQIQEREHALE
jgi:hypothetical protein